MPRRLVQLFSGLVLYGVSDGMLLLAGLGVDPWDVLHQGLARRIGLQTGTWSIIVGAAVAAAGHRDPVQCGDDRRGPGSDARRRPGAALAAGAGPGDDRRGDPQ